jgi:hypothetical protein
VVAKVFDAIVENRLKDPLTVDDVLRCIALAQAADSEAEDDAAGTAAGTAEGDTPAAVPITLPNGKSCS